MDQCAISDMLRAGISLSDVKTAYNCSYNRVTSKSSRGIRTVLSGFPSSTARAQ